MQSNGKSKAILLEYTISLLFYYFCPLVELTKSEIQSL